jgi:hypothetical protein
MYADIEHCGAHGQLEDLVEVFGEQFAVLHTEGADGVVIGMEAHRHAIVSVALDLAAAERSRRITVDQQGEHGGGRVLRVTGAAMVEVRNAQVEQTDGVEDEVDGCPSATQSRMSGGMSMGVSRSIFTKRAAMRCF